MSSAPSENAGTRRVAVVTGGNKGIGYGIVKEMAAKFDGVVILTSRDVTRGQKAIQDLNQLGLYPQYHQLDIDDESSVLNLRDYLLATYGGLDVLVNNAAIAYYTMATPREKYGESARVTVGTNYFNTSRLCKILFPLLKPHARVVNLTSGDGHLLMISGREPEATKLKSKLASPDLILEQLDQLMNDFIEAAEKGDYYERGWPDGADEREPYWPNESYIASKVGISALTRILQKQMDRDPRRDITVNCVHPGYVITDMSNNMGLKTIEEGAEAACWLAMMPPSTTEDPALKGEYVWHNKQVVDWVNGPTPIVDGSPY